MEYVADPNSAQSALTFGEVEEMLHKGLSKSFGKDPSKQQHFLHRVLVTMRLYRDQIRGMERHINELQANQERRGTASTLAPMDAARFATDEQIMEIFTERQRALHNQLLKERSALAAQRQQLAGSVQAAQVALQALLGDAGLPDAVKQRVRTAVAGTPLASGGGLEAAPRPGAGWEDQRGRPEVPGFGPVPLGAGDPLPHPPTPQEPPAGPTHLPATTPPPPYAGATNPAVGAGSAVPGPAVEPDSGWGPPAGEVVEDAGEADSTALAPGPWTVPPPADSLPREAQR